MTEQTGLYNSFALLRNVTTLVSMIDQVENRPQGTPGMAVFYGFSGFGKSTAAMYATNHYNAINVMVREYWTARKFCEVTLREMGVDAKGTVADMVEQIGHELMMRERVLIVDDAQYLVNRGIVGLLRDIYESSGGTIILIGEEGMPQKLQRWENIHGRILMWEAAQPACLADVDQLAKLVCPQVTLSKPFRELLLRKSMHSIRRVVRNLYEVKMTAAKQGAEAFGEEEWGSRSFAPCAAPEARRNLL